MTFPRETRDLLMFPPSFSLMPTAPVALARSLQEDNAYLKAGIIGGYKF